MPSVLITGASTGIGRACAERMDRAGWTVFAGVRSQAAADTLREQSTERLVPVLLDVRDAAQVAAVARDVTDRSGEAGLDGLVNNAGVGFGGPVEYLDPARVAEVLDVNLFGALRTTQALLPALRRGTPGRIVNISSIGGRWAGPYLSPYHASKWALEALSDSLRMELQDQGIEVSVVEPGTIATPIWEKGAETVESVLAGLPPEGEAIYGRKLRAHAKLIAGRAALGIPADRVAERVEHALTARRPRTRYLVGAEANAVAWLRWLLPDRWFDAMIRRASRRR